MHRKFCRLISFAHPVHFCEYSVITCYVGCWVRSNDGLDVQKREKKLLSLRRVEPLLSSHITNCVMGYNSVLQKFKAL